MKKKVVTMHGHMNLKKKKESPLHSLSKMNLLHGVSHFVTYNSLQASLFLYRRLAEVKHLMPLMFQWKSATFKSEVARRSSATDSYS